MVKMLTLNQTLLRLIIVAPMINARKTKFSLFTEGLLLMYMFLDVRPVASPADTEQYLRTLESSNIRQMCHSVSFRTPVSKILFNECGQRNFRPLLSRLVSSITNDYSEV
jgi:hypothetical protein